MGLSGVIMNGFKKKKKETLSPWAHPSSISVWLLSLTNLAKTRPKLQRIRARTGWGSLHCAKRKQLKGLADPLYVHSTGSAFKKKSIKRRPVILKMSFKKQTSSMLLIQIHLRGQFLAHEIFKERPCGELVI